MSDLIVLLLSALALPGVMVWWAVSARRAARNAQAAAARVLDGETARWEAARDAVDLADPIEPEVNHEHTDRA